MEAQLIDISEYEHSGEGANGESLNHKSDPSVMIKLYNASAPREIIESEVEHARKVYAAGIPTPEPGDFITDGKGRYGIRFQRIVGKKSFSRAVGDEPERVEEFARRFARMCRSLHATHLEPGEFPDIKKFNLNILEASVLYSDSEKEKLRNAILNAPDGDTAIHGDLQFSNAIMAGSRDYFIDLGDFACGSPLFDLGMVLFTCKYEDPQFLREVFHMEQDTASEFWIYFVKEYFGEDADPEAKAEELLPYAALKLLIIERNTGMRLPFYSWMISSL